MGKTSTRYICQQCGYESVGWLGKCPECDSWGSLVETIIPTKGSSKEQVKRSISSKPLKLSDIKASSINRISTKISELDRVLGGGLVSGQVILIAGEPGIGKSTLLTQISDSLSGEKSGNVLYVCGEESPTQVAIRAKRLGVDSHNIQLLEETDVDSVIAEIAVGSFNTIIVDSIQTMTTGDLSGMAGSVGQVRECAFRLLKAAKERGIPLFIVGHITKEGTVAGPAVLAHIVDTVLWFEGDKTLTTRVLRAVKNRFGPTDEVGVFVMEDKGLNPIDNIEKAFLDKSHGTGVSGSVVASVMQGTRPILVEVQGLVVPTKLAIPRRVAQGIDSSRLQLLIAVLTKRCGLPLYEYDVFVNVAGGLKVIEPASDFAICLAIASSYFDKPVSSKTIAVGEIGLLGEVREVVAEGKRVKEAKRMGFTGIVSSKEFKFVGEAIKKLLK